MTMDYDSDVERLARALEPMVEGTKKIVDELMRFRAWESLLYLFFARYYSGKDDPTAAAMADRDLLASHRREFAQDEEGAQQIERLFQAVFTLIKAGQDHKRGRGRDEDDAPLM